MNLRRIAPHAFSAALLITGALALPASLAAQAKSPYSKIFDIYAFGGYVNANPAYASSLYRNNGVSGGLQVAHHFDILHVDTALEARVTISTGPAIREDTYLFGLHAEHPFFHYLHPYATGLAGPGTLHFNFTNPNGYQGDNSIVYSYGGGLDLDLTSTFRLKADYRSEYWTIGHYQTFAPQVLTFGVTYHFPFHPQPENQHAFYH
jgi:opacity protein-like surface antigen